LCISRLRVSLSEVRTLRNFDFDILGDLTFGLKERDMKPQDRIGPSIFHTRSGGFLDLRNPDEESWFKKNLGQESSMTLSYLERRWLFEGFSAFNIIQGKYLDPDMRSLGFGSFGTVQRAIYSQPGIPGKTLLHQLLITLAYQVAVKRVIKPDKEENKKTLDPLVQEIYEDDVSRLAMEGVIMKKAAGPHIVSFLGLLRLSGELVLVTYISFGHSNVSTLYSKGSLKDIAFAMNHDQIIARSLHHWCKQLFSAVRWLHRLGIIHCDIKPAVSHYG
jgi:hypothetical protein